MKILHISPDENGGGAAKAAYRLHEALRASNIDSQMLVLKKLTNHSSIHVAPNLISIKFRLKCQKILKKIWKKFSPAFESNNPTLHSEGIENRGLIHLINSFDADIVNLHWINGMLSIQDIGRIAKPIVWTLHDMWPFCGAEHYTPDHPNARFITGYLESNRPGDESGPDINRFTWERKKKLWNTPMNIIAPSLWMQGCIQSSSLMRGWPCIQIPNPIDTEFWKPLDRVSSRTIKNLPNNKLIAFGAMGGSQNYYKGFQLLIDALKHLQDKNLGLELVVFGESTPKNFPSINFPIHYMGNLDDENLRLIYNSVDALLIPSRMDNLPNTGVEAMSCGTPVVAFNTGGLSDIVTHQKTGWLANAYDTEDLATGIEWVIENSTRQQELSRQARIFAINTFSYKKIAATYASSYHEILKRS
jgi:glycosyltransferase involved in cell wall biosynthesis